MALFCEPSLGLRADAWISSALARSFATESMGVGLCLVGKGETGALQCEQVVGPFRKSRQNHSKPLLGMEVDLSEEKGSVIPTLHKTTTTTKNRLTEISFRINVNFAVELLKTNETLPSDRCSVE